jgi:fructosamine-3-kinase
MWTEIDAHISQVTGEKFHELNRRSVGGGCINHGYAVTDGASTYFVKLNQASLVEMFEAEAHGLQQMLETHTIRVPKPICWGTASSSAYVVLEWIELGKSGGSVAWEEMGRQLAAMHQWAGMDKFGWDRNNTIGSTPQINSWTSNWAEFFAEHRIGYQLKLARRRGGNFSKGDRLLQAIPEILADRQPQPSLVHGDLWGGNAGFTASGSPVIFDPAAYWGDREVDIAMTELFGGFPAAFYRGYNEVFPLDKGYERRKSLYNLYHILNHFNLFGGGYGGQANGMIEKILA